MNGWVEIFNYFAFGAALLLVAIGLWLAVVIPGIDRWSRRFFLCFFFILLLCCLASLGEVFLQGSAGPGALYNILLYLESSLLSVPLVMQTVYLLHYCNESPRTSRLFYCVLGLWIVFLGLYTASPFIEGFFYITPDNRYYYGSLYPCLLLPAILIQMCNLAGTIKYRNRLPKKVFLAFLIAILPIAFALTVQMFIDVFPLIDTGYVLSALAMYSFILSDQIEQDRRLQKEIAGQQMEIARQRASVMVLQMRPHFIYNTLMSIHSLCRLDPPKAQQVTMDFTSYLRKNFNAVASEGSVPFSAELEHTRAYLAVEQALYDDMLVVDYDTPYTHFRLPPLTLQPIAENAVKHGMDPDSDTLHISIRTMRDDSGFAILVEDDGLGFDTSDAFEEHTALANIRQRLAMTCGGSLTIRPRDGGGTIVTMNIPCNDSRPAAHLLRRPDPRT